MLKTADNLQKISANPDFDPVRANAHFSASYMLRWLIFCICVVHQYGYIISIANFDISSQFIVKGKLQYRARTFGTPCSSQIP
jgi:hypothetical protein